MKKNVRFCLLRCVSISLFFLSLLSTSESQGITDVTGVCRLKECNEAARNLRDSIDRKADPCDDFYQYACGDWPKRHKNIMDPFPISSTILRAILNDHEILEFFNQTNNPKESRSIYKARMLHHICLNGNAYNRTTLLKTILSGIGLPIVPFPTDEYIDLDEATILAKATKLAGVHLFFDVSVDANPLNHRRNAIWLSKPKLDFDVDLMPTSKNQGKFDSVTNIEFVGKVLKKMCEIGSSTCCEENDNVQKLSEVISSLSQADSIIRENKLYINSPIVPKIYTLQDIQIMSENIANVAADPCRPRFNWTRYIEVMFSELKYVNLSPYLENPSEIQIVVHEMNYIQDIIRFIHTTEPETIQLMLWWKVVATHLPHADFEIFRSLSNNSEVRCQKIVTELFGMAVNYMYSKNNGYSKAKTEIKKMLQFITESYGKLFEQATWMDKSTIEKFIAKVKSIKSLVAFPSSSEFSKILDKKYGNVEISAYFLDTVVTMIQNQINGNLNKLNQINDHPSNTWSSVSNPNSLNIFYDPSKNMITIPAALLGPPLHYNSVKALIYGSIGTLVGHELTHGFDEIGSGYNNDGVVDFWWDDQTIVKYEEKSQCFWEAYRDYYSSFHGYYDKGNSTITLLQDIADNVGFKAALWAYQNYKSEFGNEASLPNFENFTSEQVFTLGFANVWCENPTPFSVENTEIYEYSPASVRVNGVLKHSREFSRIWKCPEGSEMNPSKKCSIW